MVLKNTTAKHRGSKSTKKKISNSSFCKTSLENLKSETVMPARAEGQLRARKPPGKIDPHLAARRFKILGDKNRLSIFKFLMNQPCPVGDLALALGIGRTLVSHNLKLLRSEGLVAAKRFGKSIIYTIAEDLVIENKETLDLSCCKLSFSR